MPRIMILAAILILLFPHIASAYVIPHPKEREGRRNPRIEIIRTTTGDPLRSSRGTLFYRSLPNAPDERLKKPSRRNISQIRKARMNKIRMEQNEESTLKRTPVQKFRRPSRR